MRVFDLLRLHCPPLQIGMNHVALDRSRPDDRDFDHEVIKILWLQPRQHVHLRPALDLKDAERLAPLQHLVDFFISLLDRGESPMFAFVLRKQIKTFPDAGQHAQCQHVDLHHAHFVDVVLVPLDEGAMLHRGIADRHVAVEPVLGQHVAADMLRQMPRKPDQLGRQADGLRDHRIVCIEPGLLQLLIVEALAPAAPHRVGERGRDVFRQPKRLADVADRAARPIMDDCRDDRGAMAAVAAIDILHHRLCSKSTSISGGSSRSSDKNRSNKRSISTGLTEVTPSMKQTAEFAAEPRPWQRMLCDRA